MAVLEAFSIAGRHDERDDRLRRKLFDIRRDLPSAAASSVP